MIILDTNVLSALMRDEPDPTVVRWLDAEPAESIWTTAITVFEVRTGLDLLDASHRRQRLESAFERLLADDLDGHVLAFDTAATQSAGAIVAHRQRAGRSVEIRDAQIAGISLARKASLATGNTRHFTELGVRLVDPWSPTTRRTR
ncbi:MAG TPA: type II toxin-antitoxin system VapC family toxin [Mycobacteriales bacterium]|nr:type II toxin-antitoxin system VapC family toxin [Mycobacteriales bacterium]